MHHCRLHDRNASRCKEKLMLPLLSLQVGLKLRHGYDSGAAAAADSTTGHEFLLQRVLLMPDDATGGPRTYSLMSTASVLL